MSQHSSGIMFKCSICDKLFTKKQACDAHCKSHDNDGLTKQKAKNWCFTLNNYTESELGDLMNESSLQNNNIEYIIFAKEIAPSTKTPHLQGYVYLVEKERINHLKKINKRAHWTKCNGSPLQNINYCKKIEQDTPCTPNEFVFEWGTPPLSKKNFAKYKKAGIDEINKVVDFINNKGACVPNLDVIKDNPEIYWKYPTALNNLIKESKINMLKQRNLDKPVNVYYLHGSTGTGKTYTASQMFPDADHVSFMNNFWIGYNGSKNIVIQEIRGDTLKFSTLLQLLDRAPFVMNTKGGQIQCQAENIVLTSSVAPHELYSEYVNCKNDNIAQLYRRISFIAHLGTDSVNIYHNNLNGKTCKCDYCIKVTGTKLPDHIKNCKTILDAIKC